MPSTLALQPINGVMESPFDKSKSGTPVHNTLCVAPNLPQTPTGIPTLAIRVAVSHPPIPGIVDNDTRTIITIQAKV